MKKFYVLCSAKHSGKWTIPARSQVNQTDNSGFDTRQEAVDAINAVKYSNQVRSVDGEIEFKYFIVEELELKLVVTTVKRWC